METLITEWLYDPTVGKLAASCVAIAIARVLASILFRTVASRVKDSTERYRVRKLISFLTFESTEGRVGIASMTVHLVETPTIDVRLLGGARPAA